MDFVAQMVIDTARLHIAEEKRRVKGQFVAVASLFNAGKALAEYEKELDGILEGDDDVYAEHDATFDEIDESSESERMREEQMRKTMGELDKLKFLFMRSNEVG